MELHMELLTGEREKLPEFRANSNKLENTYYICKFCKLQRGLFYRSTYFHFNTSFYLTREFSLDTANFIN